MKPTEPAVDTSAGRRNPIDPFILARLDKEGLKPGPAADRSHVIRRVTFDLTGLPPTPAEVDAFLADNSPDAYEKLVDRLLHSPRYGEQMARVLARRGPLRRHARPAPRQRTLDVALSRLGDRRRSIDNLPFDQFTIEQLAGDLLPNATHEQQIATRLQPLQRHDQRRGLDRRGIAVSATPSTAPRRRSTVWLGLTAGCAVCHDHKFDPISQKEFYSLYAFFNSRGRPGDGRQRPADRRRS